MPVLDPRDAVSPRVPTVAPTRRCPEGPKRKPTLDGSVPSFHVDDNAKLLKKLGYVKN
jgi:hypothetical protein